MMRGRWCGDSFGYADENTPDATVDGDGDNAAACPVVWLALLYNFFFRSLHDMIEVCIYLIV